MRKMYAQYCTVSSAILPIALHKVNAQYRAMKNRQKAAANYIEAACAAAGMKPTELARRLGVSASTINRPLSENPGPSSPKLETLMDIRRETGYQFTPELIREYNIPVDDNPPLPLKPDVDLTKISPINHGLGIKDLRLYAAVRGSFQGAYIDMTSPVEYVDRPPELLTVEDGFAVLVVSDSMEPRYFSGEKLYVHPRKPINQGDFVVVELEGHHGIVKRLRRRTSEYVELEQYNPPEIKKFRVREIHAMFLVVGSSSGR